MLSLDRPYEPARSLRSFIYKRSSMFSDAVRRGSKPPHHLLTSLDGYCIGNGSYLPREESKYL